VLFCNDCVVWSDVAEELSSMVMKQPDVHCLLAPSGVGKSALLLKFTHLHKVLYCSMEVMKKLRGFDWTESSDVQRLYYAFALIRVGFGLVAASVEEVCCSRCVLVQVALFGRRTNSSCSFAVLCLILP
jgi:ABC-type phosphate transport system ATPase subunit